MKEKRREEITIMGMQGVERDALPDTYGLPEYLISEVVTEIDGPNVRMVCGIRRGGVVHWLYSCVMRADQLVMTTRNVNAAACEAFNLSQMMDGRTAH